MFNLQTKESCQLADLPGHGRHHHSLCGHLLCGGLNENSSTTRQSCLMLNHLTGDFSPTSVRLEVEREDHLCWDVDGDVLLIGGGFSQRSTELVNSDGLSSSGSFHLASDTE